MQVFEVGGSWGSHFHAILHKHPATWQQITCNGWSHLKKNRWCLVLERLATPPAPGVAARNSKEPVLFHLFQITMVRLLPGALWCIHLAATNVACRSEISWHILTMTTLLLYRTSLALHCPGPMTALPLDAVLESVWTSELWVSSP